MSDVLIKGMEMPQTCYECDIEDGGWCQLVGDTVHFDSRDHRCPLVEVKPHGRLIDADEHMRVLEQMSKDAVDDVQRESFAMAHMLIFQAPTVLEATE